MAYGYLMPNSVYTYILNIYDLVWLDLWHISHCRLFNTKFCLYIYIEYIWFGLVGFYGISTIVGYLMPNSVYTYILNIYDLVWLDLWHINLCKLFNVKFSLYIWPSQLGLLNTPTASLQIGKTLPTSVLDMTLNNFMVRLQ